MSRLLGLKLRLLDWWSRFKLFVKAGFLLWLIFAMLGPAIHLLAEDKTAISLLLLMGGILVALIAFALSGARWAMVSRALAAPIPLSFALHYNFVGLFFYCVTPFGIGQDVVKVMKSVNGVSSISTGMAISQVMLDRLIGLVCLVIGFIAIAIFVFPDILITPILSYLGQRPVVIAAVAVVVLAGAASAFWFGPSLIARYTGLDVHLRQVTFVGFGSGVGGAALLSLASQFLHIAAIIMLLSAFGRAGDYWAIAGASFGSMVFFFIPISVFGVGAPQLAAAAILVVLGSSTRDAAAVVLLSYVTILVGGLVGGALEVARELKERKHPPEAHAEL